MKKGDLRKLMGRSSRIENGKQKRFAHNSSWAQYFRELNNCWGNEEHIQCLPSRRGLKVLYIFFVHKINVQEFNSKQSYLKKI